MTEIGINVENQTGEGNRVSFYEANEQVGGGEGEDRYTQLVDLAQRKHGFAVSGSVGRIRNLTGTPATDGTNFDMLSSEIRTEGALTCGDKTTLVAFARFVTTGTDTKIVLTPIVLDGDNEPLTFLTPKVSSGFTPPGLNPAFNRSDSTTIGELLSWNVLGAEKVGIHIGIDDNSGVDTVSQVEIFAKMITGPGQGEPAATALKTGTYESFEYSSGE